MKIEKTPEEHETLAKSTVERLSEQGVSLTISPGELFDRLTINYVKRANVKDHAKRWQVQHEIDKIECIIWEGERFRLPFHDIIDELYGLHCQLWDVEDRLRAADGQVFPISGEALMNDEKTVRELAHFATLARQVYILNDKRSELKKQIDELLGHVGEVKEYTTYTQGSDHDRQAE